MPRFLCYWGEGYGDASFTSKVYDFALIGIIFDQDVLDWCAEALRGDSTWDFSGPCDQFFIVRVQ